MAGAVIDVRPADAFAAGHRAGSLNLPLEELADRIHELPPTGTTITIFDRDAARAESARAQLAARDRWTITTENGDDWLAHGPIEHGPSRARLWQPHTWLADAVPTLESAWGSLEHRRAIDLASGSGRDAVYLALRGLDVEAIDILPDALERAGDLASRYAATIRTRVVDLEKTGFTARDEYDLVIVFNYLQRSLFDDIRLAVRPGGFVIIETFLVAQREHFGKPARDAHLLQPGELARLFADWRVFHYREGESGPRRIAAAIIAQKPAHSSPA